MVEQLPQTRQEVIEAIEVFCAKYTNAEWHLGHIVLSDHNLDDHSILWSLDYCFAEEHLKECSHISIEEIDKSKAFLEWLLTIPEDVRDPEDDDQEETDFYA